MAKRRAAGEGTIFKRTINGIEYWVSEVIVSQPDEPPKRKTLYGKTQAEVKNKLQAETESLRKGTFVEANKVTLEQWLGQWLESVKPNLRQTTYDSYSIQINKHLIPGLGKTQLQKLTPSQIQKFINGKLSSGCVEKNRLKAGQTALSTRTVRYLFFILHAALEKAVSRNILVKNPANDVTQPRLETKEMSVLTDEQARHLLASNKNHRLYCGLAMLLGTGMRKGELLALEWKNVNLDTGTVTITKNLVKTSAGLQVHEPKTKSGKRTFTLPDSVVEELKAHQTRQQAEKDSASVYFDNDLVFCQMNGKYLLPRNFQRTFETVWLKKAGLSHIRIHDIRHTHATLLLNRTKDIKLVSGRLGHANVRITLDTYTHVLPGQDRAAANQINDIFSL